ncbi:MAG: DUF4331 domain-containing protein [Deltaproteobacteria bacterium]|nr:MAG: DUF4331 domain-containing protein [Deltaproteobacteria bacterium]
MTMTMPTSLLRGAAALALILTGCSDGSSNKGPDGGMPPDSPPSSPAFHQVEQLARPGINEALLITEAFNAGFNAAAPSFAGVPADTLNAVVGEAKTVLKALYLGGCLLNGALSLSADQGVKPAGMTCHAVGPALWVENSLAGVTLTQASKDAAQRYADKVFSQFVPDVMRVDTSVDSNYLTLCGDASSTPLLCGGRFLNNDVIDVTYNYFLNGAATTKGPYDQFRALTGDGVMFSTDDASNVGAVTLADPTNHQQGHPNVSPTFPYSAAPF